jgi:hypothetical protein
MAQTIKGIKLTCNICFKPLFKYVYRIQKNNTKHLVGLCNEHGWRYLPFIHNLDIPEIQEKLKSKKINGQRIDKSSNGMTSLFDSIKDKKSPKKKRGGATYEWQDMASRYANKLGITKPSTSWWKFFRSAYEKNRKGLLIATYSAVVEIIPPNAEKYFYKVYYEKQKENS